MATTITSNEGFSSSTPPDQIPSFTPEAYAEDQSFEKDLLRPSIEAEKKYQEEGLKIRQKNYQTIKKHTLDFDNFEPDQTSEVKNRVLVSGYLDSQFTDENKPSNDHDILRDAVATQRFNGEGVGSDEAFVAAIRKDFEGENEKQAFYDNADRQALLSAYLGGGRARREFRESVQGNPLAKSERREINERWRKTQEKIEEDLGMPMLYDIRTTFEEMGTDDDWLMHAAHRTRNYSDEEKDKFKIALRDLATTYPSEAGSTFGGNLGKGARRGVGGALDKGSEAAMEFFRNAGVGVHNVFVAPFAENFGSEEAQEWSQQKRKDSAEWLRSERDAVDWMAELRDIQEGDFAPTRPLAPKDTSLRAIEEGIYAIPGAITTSAVAFIPVVGMPLSFGMMKEFDREKYRREILDNGGSRDDAYRLAGGMSMVSAVPNMMLEKFQSYGLTGRIPGMGKVFGKIDDIFANKVGRFGTKMFVAGAAETTVELTQHATTDLVQDITSSFEEAVPGIEWKNGKDGHFDGYFNKTLTTFVAVAPLGVMVAGRGLTQERRAEAMKQASPLERKAFGITEEASKALDEAKTPRETVEAFHNAVKTREPFSDTAQESVMELEEMHKMRTQTNEDAETFGVSPSVRRTPDKSTFEVFDRLTGDTLAEVDTAQEATEEVFEQLQMKEEESRQYFQELLASFEAASLDVEQSGEAVEVGTGTFTDADAEAAMPGSDRRLQTERELTEQRDGGTGAVAKEVMSEGQSGSIAGVYVPAGKMGRKEAVTQIHNGSSVLTLIHERGHAKRRKLMESGAWTRADQISSLRELDNLIAKVDEKFLPENFEGLSDYDQEVALDEAIAELSESLALNSRKGKNSKMGGLIQRNLSAMVQARIPGAAQLKSFLGSMRDFFGLQLKRATILRKAVRDGNLDQAQVDQLTDMLVGTNSQEVFEQERDAIPTQMVDGQQVAQEGDVKFQEALEHASKGWVYYTRDQIKRVLREGKTAQAEALLERLEVGVAQSEQKSLSEGERKKLEEARQAVEDQQVDTPFSTGKAGLLSLGNTTVTPNAETKTYPTKDGGVVGPASFSITAHHGTPHKVDKFSTKNIGTGEGAQAYGWGLYFAAARKVAQKYQKMRSDILEESGQYDRDIAALKEHLEGVPNDIFAQRQLEGIRERKEDAQKRKGSLYTVELNVEQDELLDWDKPLREQSELVQNVINEEYRKRGEDTEQENWGWQSGAMVYKDMTPEEVRREQRSLPRSKRNASEISKQASEALAAVGIKGIRYLDGDSRADGEGTSNYVIFNDADITITEENGQVVDTASPSFSITPAQDAEYLELAKNPEQNRSALQKLVDQAARAAGYLVGPVYHGSKSSDIKAFDPGKHSFPRSLDAIGTWFTTEESQTKRYAFDAITYRQALKMNNPLTFELKDVIPEMQAGQLRKLATRRAMLEDNSEGDSELSFQEQKESRKFAGEISKQIDELDAQTRENEPFYALVDTWRKFHGGEQFGDPQAFVNHLKSKGYDGIHLQNTLADFGREGSEYADWYIAFDSNQSKSTDPVTKDADGNVIPLSQRFDQSRDEIAFSPGDARMLSDLSENVMRRVRAPEARAVVFEQLVDRIDSLKRDVAKMIFGGAVEQEAIPDARSMKSLKKEAAFRQADLREQYEKDGVEQPAKQARTEANEWLEEEVAKQKKHYNPVARIRRSLVMYDAVLKTLPPELRGKMGGFVQIGKLNSDQKRLEFLEKKLEQLDVEVDKWISGKHRKQIEKIFKANRPKKKSSGQAKVDSDATYADQVMEIEKIAGMTREQVDAEIEEIDQSIEKEEDEFEIMELTDRRDKLSVFGHIDGMKANALGDFYQNLNTIHRQGKLLKAMSDEQFNQFLQETIEIVNNDVTGSQGEMTQSEAKLKDESRKSRVIPTRFIGAEDVKIDGLADFQRKNISWEWILNSISRANKAVGTLASETNKRLSTMVHIATHQEKRDNLTTQEQFREILAGIFGVIAPGQTSINMDLTNKIQEMEEVEQTNISKMEYGKEGRSTTRRIPASKVQALLNGEATIEGLGISESDWTAIQVRYAEIKDGGKSIKPNTRVEYESQTEGESKMMALSQSQAINLTMLWRQKGLKDSMEHEGYSDQTMKDMEDFLTTESKEIREWLTIQYEDNYHKINKVFRAQNGFSLPKTDFYSPAIRMAQKEAKDMSIDSEGRQAMSVDPNFTITRTTNRAPMDQTAGALNIWIAHSMQTNHYVAWADTVKVLRSVFSDKSVRTNIRGYVGKSALETIDERLDWFADGGNRKATHIAALDKLRAAHTYGSLGFKWSIAMKQLTSLPAYAFDMSFKDFGKYFGLFAKDFKKNIGEMLDTPYVQTRFKSGYERDVIDGLRREGGSKFMKALQVGMLSGKAGDIVPVIIGGWMARQRSYDNSKKAGLSDADARKKSDIDFEMITDRAQQAGDMKDLSSFQGGGSMFKLFTMYKTSPRQYYANVSESFLDMRAGKEGSKKDFARRFFIAQVMLPLTFQFVSDITKAPFRDDDEETISGENYLRAMLLGPLNGIFIMGDALDMIASGIADTTIWAKKVTILDGVQEVAQGFGKLNAGGLISSFMSGEDWDGDITGAADKIARGMGRITPGAMTFYDIIRDEIKRLEGITEVFD